MLTRVLSNSAPSLVSRCASLLAGLILVEGVAWGSGECNQQLSAGCWWGENVLGAREKPIELSVPERLVISPHVYGHGSQSYMSDAAFPANMPPLWDLSWGTLNDDMDVPVVLGEWGGLWSATSAWQATMAAYLKERHIGYFYWALNDNYFRTGGLYGPTDDWHAEKLAMLDASPTTVLVELVQNWTVPPPPFPPREPPSAPPIPAPPPPSPPPPTTPPPSPPPPMPPPTPPPRPPPDPPSPPPPEPPTLYHAVEAEVSADVRAFEALVGGRNNAVAFTIAMPLLALLLGFACCRRSGRCRSRKRHSSRLVDETEGDTAEAAQGTSSTFSKAFAARPSPKHLARSCAAAERSEAGLEGGDETNAASNDGAPSDEADAECQARADETAEAKVTTKPASSQPKRTASKRLKKGKHAVLREDDSAPPRANDNEEDTETDDRQEDQRVLQPRAERQLEELEEAHEQRRSRKHAAPKRVHAPMLSLEMD